MSDDALEPDRGEPIAAFRLSKVRDVKASDLAIRFGFGAGISIVASLAGTLLAPVVGGMFLAFPAILPATLTLLEQKQGTDDAVHDVRGAVLGSVGLVAFAITAAALFAHTGAAIALGAATAAWTAVAFAAYFLVVAWRHTHRPAHGRHTTTRG